MTCGQLQKESSLLQVMICDDDPEFRIRFRQAVGDTLDQMNIDHRICLMNGKGDITPNILNGCDLVFLDLKFAQEDYNGIDIARMIRQYRKDAVIIFVSDYIEYAPEGYEVQAFRYLLKPKAFTVLPDVLEKAVSRLHDHSSVLKIKNGGDWITLPVESILYAESRLRTVILHVLQEQEEKQYLCYAAISDLEQRLEGQGFLRTQRSYLVNMQFITRYQCHEVELMGRICLPASEKSYSVQKKKYLLWKGNESWNI